jgi:hypothetical protein
MLELLPPYCSILIPFQGTSDSWLLWDRIRLSCGCSPRLHVALQIDDAFTLCEQWYAEPVRLVVFSTTLWISTPSYPNLQFRDSKMQSSLDTLCKLYFQDSNVKVVVSHADVTIKTNLTDYVSFLWHHINLASSHLPNDESSIMARYAHQKLIQIQGIRGCLANTFTTPRSSARVRHISSL